MDCNFSGISIMSQQLGSSVDERFLSRSYESKEDFVREYQLSYVGKSKTRELYLLVLTKLENAVIEGNVENFKIFETFIEYISGEETPETLEIYYNDARNSIKTTNLIILACKHGKIEVLDCIISFRRVLFNLSNNVGKNPIKPDDEDEMSHNAFYYAVRSGNTELLDTLIDKWPGNYFATHLDRLDELLSSAYEELKLKNVPLSDEIEMFVESKLINLRFYSDPSVKVPSAKDNLNNIKERVNLVLESIRLLSTEYSSEKEVDDKFLFVARFVARNLHVLKRQLKSTYDTLPWEEIEFCLVCFVSSHLKREEINLLYHTVLNKYKLLDYLKHFAKRLEDEKNIIEIVNIGKLVDLPKLSRQEVVSKITSSDPRFTELYNDYEQVRDMHSLKKMADSFNLALSANPKEKEGQLIIARALQVIGEYLKNTLESPKLSNSTSEFLLLSLPKNTRKIITKLRDSLSHSYSLSKRIEIEETADVNFFTGVQNDINMVYAKIIYILCSNKKKIIKMLLTKIAESTCLNEMKEIAGIVSNAELNSMILNNFKTMEHEKLEKHIKVLSDNVTEKTTHEMDLFNEVYRIIGFIKAKTENMKTDHDLGFTLLKSLNATLSLSDNIDHNFMRVMKFSANTTLQNITSQMESHTLTEITELVMKIFSSVITRTMDYSVDQLNEIKRSVLEIFYIVEFGIDDIKWIEKLKQKLLEKGSFNPTNKGETIYNSTKKKPSEHLVLKFSELKVILNSYELGGELTMAKLPYYKNNKQLLAVVEILVLDILSILGESGTHLENNYLFFDDNAPLLIGKSLRNHLAHGNVLLDVLSSNPDVAVILNAVKLISENVTLKDNKKIGKLLVDNQLTRKYKRTLSTIINQENMFAALQEGNLEDLNNCLKKGADINAKNVFGSAALHFAARGSNIEIVKFILDLNLNVKVRDVNGQSPLHIAAACGRKNIVELLINKTYVHADDPDKSGKTSLHTAAKNGHKETIEFLLKNNASTDTKDTAGFSPLHYAIINNHIDAAKVLIREEDNVDINETMGGYTSLHLAAESGFLELVNFLLENGANVDAKNDKEGIPLHTAALNGHTEVVKALIHRGCNVNSRVVDGCTPLHYAVENGHVEVVDILLKHGANVDVVDKTFNNTPLHYAAIDGCEAIVEALLKKNANVNIATSGGITPLHSAAKSGHLDIVASLLNHGVDIHSLDENNYTPLHYAAEFGHEKIVELLISHGVEVDAKAVDHLTPLHLAALKGYEKVVDSLIRNNANINSRDIRGSTPVFAAAQNGSKAVIDLLLQNKADVRAKTTDGITLLHIAAAGGHRDVVVSLIQSKAHDVNAKDNNKFTPLLSAVVGGHKDIVNLLLENNAKVDGKGAFDCTPLYTAVEMGNKEIVQILVANGANVNVKVSDFTPLLSAIKHNNKEIFEFLVANGADVNADHGKPLLCAVVAGNKDILDALLKNNARIDITNPFNETLLHLAAKRGDKAIVNVLIAKKVQVDTTTSNGVTPLYVAAQEGHAEIVEILIANKANVNRICYEGTPLHIAAALGHGSVVEVLLRSGAKVDCKDFKNRTPFELAVARGHLDVVEILLQCKKVDLNAKGNDDFSILHIVAQKPNLDIVKLLVDKGCNINAKNASGSKPIHIAAREGNKETVEFFLGKGLSVDDFGLANQTPLHYAAIGGKSEVVEFLIEKGANINAKDRNGTTPMHIAAEYGFKGVIEVLLRNGAFYNCVDNRSMQPSQASLNEDVFNLFVSIEKLFHAVKYNFPLEVENCIKAGAFVNAKNADNETTPLHYAAWKGWREIVSILLQNKANPNAMCSKGFTPLHYAAKFSNIECVKALLHHGAKYGSMSISGKKPSDLAVDKGIIGLFNLINKAFEKIENCDVHLIYDLNNVKSTDILKAIMNACNGENRTLIAAAKLNNFPKVEELMQVSQGNVSAEISEALKLLSLGEYQYALNILQRVFEKRKEVLGPNNPGTVNIQTHIAKGLYKLGNYQEASNMLKEILSKQEEFLGSDDEDTLDTRSTIALVLHRLDKNEEALDIYRDVYEKQKEKLGLNHSYTINTQFHMALVLDKLGKYEEALNINRAIFEKRTEILGSLNLATLSAQNNIAMVLGNQGKHEESLKIYEDVLKKKTMILGIDHADTLRTLCSIAGILFYQKKYNEALKTFQEVLNTQKITLPQNHPEILNTEYNIANVLFIQGKWINALKSFQACLGRCKAVFGPNHSRVLDILTKIQIIYFRCKLEGNQESEVLQHIQKDINIASSDGDVQTVQRLLHDGANFNDSDIDGRTPLHYASNNGHLNIVSILLKNGADVTRVTNKGNTPLHTATSKNHKKIVELLLNHVVRDKLYDFVNAKTVSGGTTSLHVAAKNGFLENVRCLLKHSAAYNILDKESRTPLDLSKDKKITELLKLIHNLFIGASKGNGEILNSLKALKPDDFLAVTNARNDQGHGLLQVALINNHKKIANKLLEMLRKN